MKCIVLVLLAALCAQATAQACPTTVCNSYFANAMGGPIDCCKWDYNKGTCKWAGTPVSFKLVRTCADGSTVLIGSNTQGPSGNNECRCPNANRPTFSALTVCATMTPRVDMDISGFDITCGGSSFCKVCGGLDAVKNGCVANGRCVAFTYEIATGCGFLKSGSSTSSRSGWVAYTR